MNGSLSTAFCLLLLVPPAPAADRAEAPTTLVDVNRASRSELEALPGIGVERAKLIVRLREHNGPFRNIEELRALPRLSEKQFEALRRKAFAGAESVERKAAETRSKLSR